MKAEEIKTRTPAELIKGKTITIEGIEYVTATRAKSLMLKFAFELMKNIQSPPVSEEEIKEYVTNEFTDISCPTTYVPMRRGFWLGAKWVLSCLPHEQPVGKVDKSEAEQPREDEPLNIDEHIIK